MTAITSSVTVKLMTAIMIWITANFACFFFLSRFLLNWALKSGQKMVVTTQFCEGLTIRNSHCVYLYFFFLPFSMSKLLCVLPFVWWSVAAMWNVKKITLFLKLFPAQYSSPKYYEQAVSVLAKVFVHCQCTLMSLGEESIHTKLLPKLRWTLSEQVSISFLHSKYIYWFMLIHILSYSCLFSGLILWDTCKNNCGFEIPDSGQLSSCFSMV